MSPPAREQLIALLQNWQAGAAQAALLFQSAITLYASPSYWAQPYHNSKLSGQAWVEELMNGHPERIRTELGVHLHVFLRLLVELRILGYHHSKHVRLEEQLAIFLYTCVTGLSTRHVGERFQRANETIAHYFKKMTGILSGNKFYNDYVKLPLLSSPIPWRIRNDPKLFPFFKDCIGALDGSHIACAPSAEDRGNMRNSKGFLSQNVLAACNFALRFLYILSGWDGSVTDSFLFGDARVNDFRIPPGRYYLADAGFLLCPQLMTPYRSTRYHLREWALGNHRPRTKEELYNLRHAQARNVIERIFGVVKNRWSILVNPAKYDMDLQAQIPAALAALHNFILEHDPEVAQAAEYDITDEEFGHLDDFDDPAPGVREDADQRGQLAEGQLTNEDSEEGKAMRDQIATNMWADYCRVLAERGETVEEMDVEDD